MWRARRPPACSDDHCHLPRQTTGFSAVGTTVETSLPAPMPGTTGISGSFAGDPALARLQTLPPCLPAIRTEHPNGGKCGRVGPRANARDGKHATNVCLKPLGRKIGGE